MRIGSEATKVFNSAAVRPAKPNIVAIPTDSLTFPAAAFLATRLSMLNPREDTQVVILSNSFPDLAAAKAVGIPDELKYVQFSGGHIPPAAARVTAGSFYRLFVPELLPEARRILSLDIDTYPESAAIFSLFDLDMAGHAVAAVRDVYMAYGRAPESVRELERTGCGNGKYLNAGVLLIDRAAFVVADLGRRAFDTALKRRFHDQAALNFELAGVWLELSPAMNMTTVVRNSFVRQVVEPAIVHFMGPVKPWHGPRFGENHPVRAHLEKFLLASPWKNMVAQNFSFEDAWSNTRGRQGLPMAKAPVRGTKTVLPAGADMNAIAAYLRHTVFADVASGLVGLHLDAIPSRAA